MARCWVRRVFTLCPALAIYFLVSCSASYNSGIVYTRKQLIDLNKPAVLRGVRLEIPKELRKRRRGCRAGVKRREKKRKYRPYLPSITMGNVRSLMNKVDELAVLTRSQKEYRECSLMCFTETWLHDHIHDSNVTITGFQTVRADRSRYESGKRKGGGLALLVNNRWCHPNHISVKEQLCCPDTELIAVSLRPYYMPREFSHAIVLVVYIPPSADAKRACDVIYTVTAKMQTDYPNAFIAISGDFNHATLSSTLCTFKQFVNCRTREDKILDLLYVNVKEAYSSTPLPPLGKSDHNLVHLRPLYKPLIQQQLVITRQ
ncbi:hypothetical protein LDENG_00161750 [Lucifuga dentata]|nr:hypothetical protein LDENG_00161750 [Lucifuga dentata]